MDPNLPNGGISSGLLLPTSNRDTFQWKAFRRLVSVCIEDTTITRRNRKWQAESVPLRRSDIGLSARNTKILQKHIASSDGALSTGHPWLNTALISRSVVTHPQASDTYCYAVTEVNAMIDHCRQRQELEWMGDVILFLTCTGLRIGELASLRPSDIQRDPSDTPKSCCGLQTRSQVRCPSNHRACPKPEAEASSRRRERHP